MEAITEGALLWKPTDTVKNNANLTRYMRWLEREYGLTFQTYEALWLWSVTDLERFWESIWRFFEVKSSREYSSVLDDRRMPGATWFAGARLNYAEHFFRNMNDQRPAILYKAENEPLISVSWHELYHKTTAIARALKKMGVQRGDRVVAYMPNIPEAVAAVLACASLGAVWSSCSPDFGGPSVLDRFRQIEPKVLIAADGYYWNGKKYDRRDVVAELQAALTTLEHTILVTLVSEGSDLDGLGSTVLWDQLLDNADVTTTLGYEDLPFDHPLWVLYSSGTTGLPKPIVQGHGGILLEHLKVSSLHLDLKPEDRFFWFTSTGWMMWNFLMSGLLHGCTVILYNGSPAYPSLDRLWQLAEEAGMTYFGTGAAYIAACINAGIRPNQDHDLSRIKAFGSTGSPLSIAGFQWVYENVNQHLALESFSGGTDLCTGFVGGSRLLPIYAGELQCRCLGAKVEAFNEAGQSIIDEVGELVITEPMPSMPLFFWNDPNKQRYLDSYFEMFPGVWRHGDWIKINQRGGCVIYGRSDSTINRHGVRMGTSEIYQAIEEIPEIIDSLVVDLEALGQESYLPLFVVLQEGAVLDNALKEKIKDKIRQNISPRHVPDEIFAVDEIPMTLSGKKMEVPVRKILLGQPVEKAANPGAMRNPESIRFFVDLAKQQPK